MNRARRNLVSRGLCACVLCGAHSLGLAKVLPSNLTPVVGPGYRPVDDDERGLWQSCEELEKELSASSLLVGDPRLTAYITAVLAHLLPDRSADIRVYVVHDPEFNASMTPNGMMIVYTGLLARMRNEAQLAAVLGHECGHYLRRHTVQSWRNFKTKTGVAAFLSAVGVPGVAINQTLLLSLSSYSRALESEADAYGLELLTAGGYPPRAAAEIWSQLIAERKASAAERKKRYRDTSIFSTHPPNAERLQDLSDSAAVMERASAGHPAYSDRRKEWLAAIAPLRPGLIEEQVKLNDPGASLYLINALAQDGWDGTLLYYQGEVYRMREEPGDAALAAEAYAAAVKYRDAPAQAYRAYGYAQIKAGKPEEGHKALQRYLQMSPDAPDALMIRSIIGP